MNTYLLTAGVVSFLLAPLHSLLGERRIFAQLLHQEFPPIRGSRELTKKILRYFWHVIGLFWWGFAVVLWRFAAMPSLDPAARFTTTVIACVFLATSAWLWVATRGRHFGWWLFLLVATLIGLGLL